MNRSQPFEQRKRMTFVGEALATAIDRQPKPVLTNYEIFLFLWNIYSEGEVRYLRGDVPTKEGFRRVRRLLREEGVIRPDHDYTSLWRVLSKPDDSAENIICAVDANCYVSHISAMQRYGLTNRRPEALALTQPSAPIRKEMLIGAMEHDYGEALEAFGDEIEPARAISHPAVVRGRPIRFHTSKFFGEHLQVRGEAMRIATVAQTFLDMLDDPDECGGISHVLEAWEKHAGTYLEEIILRVDRAEKLILKIRAGYILDERMKVRDPRITAWLKFAQRGSSRVLNPGKPFDAHHSEKWMLSINV